MVDVVTVDLTLGWGILDPTPKPGWGRVPLSGSSGVMIYK
jgi:hypothetical protein